MNRELTKLANNVYELLIIGGGIYGACVAWEATLRGLSVALVDKGDFGAATSANSLKIIHGGLRYLQHADLRRMRQSIQERTNLMRIAPHLVHPLPVMLPTYGHGLKSKEVLALALFLNDLIGSDRNYHLDPQKHIPRGKTIGKQTCQQLLPGIASKGLTGAAIFHDAQVYNSERLTLAFIRSATQRGATVANYVEVKELLRSGQQITGVQVEDQLTQQQFAIQAKSVVNTTGGWINEILERGKIQSQPLLLAKAMNLVLRRPLFSTYAVGIDPRNRDWAKAHAKGDGALRSRSDRDPDAVLDKGSRLLFVVPWRGRSMVGTYYSVCDCQPESWAVTETEIEHFLAQVNQAYPPAQLTREDVAWVHQGVLPRTGISSTGEPILAKHYQIKDHAAEGLAGLVSVIGVKYTTARNVAQKTVDWLFKSWGKTPPPSTSATTPLHGGQISRFDAFLQEAIGEGLSAEFISAACTPRRSPRSANANSLGLKAEVMNRLVYNYGSAYPEVLQYLDTSQKSNNRAVIKAEVLYGIREEMAQTLKDVVFRRTELGSAGNPGKELLCFCAEVMGAELGWNQVKIEQELQEVNDLFRYFPTEQAPVGTP